MSSKFEIRLSSSNPRWLSLKWSCTFVLRSRPTYYFPDSWDLFSALEGSLTRKKRWSWWLGCLPTQCLFLGSKSCYLSMKSQVILNSFQVLGLARYFRFWRPKRPHYIGVVPCWLPSLYSLFLNLIPQSNLSHCNQFFRVIWLRNTLIFFNKYHIHPIDIPDSSSVAWSIRDLPRRRYWLSTTTLLFDKH